MIIDNTGEMAVLLNIIKQSGRLGVAASNRIQELHVTGRADFVDDPTMHDLIRSMCGIISCLDLLEKRYPELTDEIAKEYNWNRTAWNRTIRKTDKKLRSAVLTQEESSDRMNGGMVYKRKIPV